MIDLNAGGGFITNFSHLSCLQTSLACAFFHFMYQHMIPSVYQICENPFDIDKILY